MKRGRLLSLLGVFTVLGLWLFARSQFVPRLSHERFVSHQEPYFAEVAGACDMILKKHQGITKSFLTLAGDDSTLPNAILSLGADEVRIYPERVWIGFDAGRDSFAILWETKPDDPGSLALMTDFDGILNPVYVRQK